MTISPTRKSVIMLTAITAGLGFAALTSAATQAAEKPAIEVITHAGAGGGTDVNSRMMMLRGRRTLKQDMVVVNKRGGGGAAAMNYFMSHPADGNTILTFTVGHAITMSKGKTKLKVEDLAPLARGTNDPQILMVSCRASPYKTPEDFVAGMKNGDKLKFGGTQSGTIDHITVFLRPNASACRCRPTFPSRAAENWRHSWSRAPSTSERSICPRPRPRSRPAISVRW